jgi:glutamyl-tRNA synthetase
MNNPQQNNSDIKVRFAPSPTGPLHIGGLRTAIFNWLFARVNQGTLLLRVEDTDRQRSESRYTDEILRTFDWMGLDFDDTPIYQSERLQAHQDTVAALLIAGHAYPCFCSLEEIQTRQKAKGLYKYDRTCLELTAQEQQARIEAGDAHVVRFRVPEGSTEWDDLIHGPIRVENTELEDFVLLRQDESPTYQVAVVSDDHDMGISHVIRGDDHLSNTPKQILLYRAMQHDVPQFGHIPLIFGMNKKKLSKRHGPVSVEDYAAQGYLPEALLNYLTLLGWSPGDDTEIFSAGELLQRFSLEGVSASNAIFDEQKLAWMNGEYITAANPVQLRPLVIPVLQKYNWAVDDTDFVDAVIELLQSRTRTLQDFAAYGCYFFEEPTDYDEKARRKHWKDDVRERLHLLKNRLENLVNFGRDTLETALRELADERQMKAALFIHPVRLAVTGMSVSPDIFAVLHLLGRERVIHRIVKAIAYLEKFPTDN